MKFHPEEILFSLTAACNLNCPHCVTEKLKGAISKRLALKFISDCKKHHIEKIGFTGGEPFLELELMCALVKRAVKEGMFFNRIMTNGVWWRSKKELKDKLYKLFMAGYDGSICISVDILHRQNLKKLSHFIKTASSIWGRKDLISIAYVKGYKDKETRQKIMKFLGKPYSISIIKIDLSPIGKAFNLKNPWDGRWFKEDYCQGPGNVLFVLPDGDVKPCCGYAADMKQLTIGNIKHDTVTEIIKNANKNRFVFTVSKYGLSTIRKRLQKIGVKFPGKTSNHCYFCWYVLLSIFKLGSEFSSHLDIFTSPFTRFSDR